MKLLRDASQPIELRAAAGAALAQLVADAHEIFPDLLQLILTEKPGDPLGRIDETLGDALNVLAPDPYAAKLVTDKDLFYRAVDRLLCNPRASCRKSGMLLIEKMPVEDFHLVGEQVADVLADKSRNYHSYHNLKPRQGAIMLYANLGIEGGIDAALDILDEETGKGSFKLRMLMDVLPRYGAAAKPYLPQLRAMKAGRLTKRWEEMLQKIEAAPPSNGQSITFEQAMKAGSR